MKPKFVLSTALGLIVVLLSPSASQAQSHFYGYYYPDEHRFTSWQLNTQIQDFSTVTPMWNVLNDRRPGYSYPIVPTNTPLSPFPAYYPPPPAAYSPPVATPRQQVGSIRLIVPDAQAKVWFQDYGTQSTGPSREFVTPPLARGETFTYQIKVTWMELGIELALERNVTVAGGQTVVVDFREAAASLRAARALAAARR